jgi:hypothetical protein
MGDATRPDRAAVLAEPTGERLDAWVYGLAIGCPVQWVKMDFGAGTPPEPQDGLTHAVVPRFSADWAAVGWLIDWMYGRGWEFGIYSGDGQWWAGFAGRTSHEAAAATFSLAAARAALLAVLGDA